MKLNFTKRKFFYWIYLFCITLILLECILRFYNPFHFRIKGDKIVLQTNKQFIVTNEKIPVLDKRIVHTKNSLGFRGTEMPNDFSKYVSILTVGGSTTECNYLSDGYTWSDNLSRLLQNDFKNAWLNNAGLAGHSTFGHQVLLEDYLVKLHPKIIIFLVGCNDVGREDLNDSDKSSMVNYYRSLLTFLSKKTEVFNVLANIFRARQARTKNMTDTFLDLEARKNDTLLLSQEIMDLQVKQLNKSLVAYEQRLRLMVQTCRKNGIGPVLVTQPTLLGSGIDSATGANLETLKINDHLNGMLWWKQLEIYNAVTRKVAKEDDALLIDLSRLMPKKSVYFYDMIHFTTQGAEKVGTIIYSQLKSYIAATYPDYLKN